METDEVCDRPLETFGAATLGLFLLDFIVTEEIALTSAIWGLYPQLKPALNEVEQRNTIHRHSVVHGIVAG